MRRLPNGALSYGRMWAGLLGAMLDWELRAAAAIRGDWFGMLARAELARRAAMEAA